MNNQFTPPVGPFAGGPGFGFGAGPAQRRAMHGARRQARQEFIEHLRENAGGHDGPLGFGQDLAPVSAVASAPASAPASALVSVVAGAAEAVVAAPAAADDAVTCGPPF